MARLRGRQGALKRSQMRWRRRRQWRGSSRPLHLRSRLRLLLLRLLLLLLLLLPLRLLLLLLRRWLCLGGLLLHCGSALWQRSAHRCRRRAPCGRRHFVLIKH